MLYSRISLLIPSKCCSLHLLTPNSQSIPIPPPRQPQACRTTVFRVEADIEVENYAHWLRLWQKNRDTSGIAQAQKFLDEVFLFLFFRPRMSSGPLREASCLSCLHPAHLGQSLSCLSHGSPPPLCSRHVIVTWLCMRLQLSPHHPVFSTLNTQLWLFCTPHSPCKGFFFFFCHTHGIWKFSDQRSNLIGSCNLRHSCGNVGPLTHFTGIKPVPQQGPKLLQRQLQILNPLCQWELQGFFFLKKLFF